MKQIGNIVLGGLLLLFSVACSKDDITLPESNDPVFRAEGTFGADGLDLIAGDNGMYMHTFTGLNNGVKVFSGELTDGNFGLQIGLYDGDVDMTSSIPLNVIKQSDNWAFESGQDLAIISKEMFPNHLLIDEIIWMVNGVFAGSNTLKIDESGVYEVCALVTYVDGSSSVLCNELSVGFERNGNFKLRHYSSQSGELSLWMEDIVGEVDSVSWFVDNEFVGSGSDYSGIVTAEQHSIEAKVIFTNGARRNRSMIVDGLVSGHFIDDFTGFEQDLQNMITRDYNWIVKLQSNGDEYSSLYADNSNSTIEVDDVSYYGLNSAGNRVYKITATFNGTLRRLGSNQNKALSINTVFGLEIVE
jgi:hypothetical protein